MTEIVKKKKVIGRPFVKGDPRANRKGRPPVFDKARQMMTAMANETKLDEDGKPYLINGKEVTHARYIAHDWRTSDDVAKQKLFWTYVYGKVPNETELTVTKVNAIELDQEMFEAYYKEIVDLQVEDLPALTDDK